MPMTLNVQIGGQSRGELQQQLAAAGIQLNALGQQLLNDPRFFTAAQRKVMTVCLRSVAELGLEQGGTWSQLLTRGREQGLDLCPLELSVHLRLQYTDQPEGALDQPQTRLGAPPGSLTVISPWLDEDYDQTPRGFYLRTIEGVLWLRGYRCDDTHVWSPQDRLVFCQTGAPAQGDAGARDG